MQYYITIGVLTGSFPGVLESPWLLALQESEVAEGRGSIDHTGRLITADVFQVN